MSLHLAGYFTVILIVCMPLCGVTIYNNGALATHHGITYAHAMTCCSNIKVQTAVVSPSTYSIQ